MSVNNNYKQFVAGAASISLLLVVLFVGMNFLLDPFGLFSAAKGRVVPISFSERASKYLLSLKYVPENYDSIMLGPSLSDHLDISMIRNAKAYNLSLQGGNIFEMNLLARNVMDKGQIKLLLICLDPYILRNRFIQDERMQPQMRQAALGSTFMMQYYFERLTLLLKGRGRFSGFGPAGNLVITYPPGGSEAAIKSFAKILDRGNLPEMKYDKVALDELKSLVDEANKRNIRVVGFYFPVPYDVISLMRERYDMFRTLVDPLFHNKGILLDFSDRRYPGFARDYSNFSDQGHLSNAGAAFIVSEIDKAIAQSSVR